jgi:DNA polymerase III delta prime subunit
MTNTSAEEQTFDVFLCHNSEDKPEIRKIANALVERGVKVWLDEREIRPGSSWQSALEAQLESIKSAAVFVGKSGIGPWQTQEVRAFINEFVERQCPIIPVILSSAKETPRLPILLKQLHYVDFRQSEGDPIEKLCWGITGQKLAAQQISSPIASKGSSLLPDKERQTIELRLPLDINEFSAEEKETLLIGLTAFLKIGQVKISAIRPGSTRIFLDLSPEEADRLYNAARSGQLLNLGISEARLYPSLSDPPDAKERSELLILLSKVNDYWVEGVFKQSLHHEVLLSLGKRFMEEVVNPPWQSSVALSSQRQRLSISDNRIDSLFDATGLLLILGEPGSGKTTTMLELVTALVKRAKTDPKERIPIVLNLSSWKPSQTLPEWMAEKLNGIYGVPRKIAHQWLERDYLIPLLDGLDEVRTDCQQMCVEAINAYIGKAEPAALVVCCRISEYQWLPDPLNLNGAVCIEPLNIEQITEYFDALGKEFESVRRAIREDSELQELAQSPLMLNVMAMAYGTGHTEFTSAHQPLSERRSQIFNDYVDEMFRRKAKFGSHFPRSKVMESLGWLAHQMSERSQSVFLIEQLQPEQLCKKWLILSYRMILSLIYSLPLLVITVDSYSVSIEKGFPVDASILEWLLRMLLMGLPAIISDRIFLRLIASIAWSILDVMIFGVWFVGNSIGADVLLYMPFYVFYNCVVVDKLGVIKLVEEQSWSWRKFFISSFIGLLLGVAFGILSLGVAILAAYIQHGGDFTELFKSIALLEQQKRPTYQDIGPDLMIMTVAVFGIVVPPIIFILVAVFGGIISKVKEKHATPNEGIKTSFANGVKALLIADTIAILVGWVILGLDYYSENGKVYLIYFTYLSVIMGQRLGINTAIKHYLLRTLLGLNSKIPFRLPELLDYCSRLIFLKKIGGGYIFIHRMLLEYFADGFKAQVRVEKS